MGISLFLVWDKYDRSPEMKERVKTAGIFFLIHLALNVLWSALFFGLHRPDLAFAEIIVLWAMIVLLIVSFWPIDRRASYLLVPYLIWVSFASILNLVFWQLNP